MTDQDKEDFIRRYIRWQQNGMDLEKRNPLVLNFGSEVALNYPQIRYYISHMVFGIYTQLSCCNFRVKKSLGQESLSSDII